jgi:phosphoserine phosphatase RsbU/P
MTDFNNRILVVDDDPGIRNSFIHILTPPKLPDILSAGASLFEEQIKDVEPVPAGVSYELTVVESGEKGVRVVGNAVDQKKPFTAAFIDMKMPGMDGAEAAQRILSIDADIKIVIVTAFSEFSIDEIVRKVGRENIFYLRKPFNTEEIRQFVRALANQWNLEREKELLTHELNSANEQLLKYAEDLNNSISKLQNEIAERKRVEAALKKSEEKYRTILESIQESYMESDLEGNIVFFNNAACRMLGYSPDELAGKSYKQLTDESTAQNLFTIFNNVFKTGKPLKGAGWEFIRKNGEKRHAETSILIIKDHQGHRVGFRGVAHDVTERKLDEIALRKSQEALAKAREREIDVASRIQRTLLLGNVPQDILGFDVNEVTIPSQKVDGDFFDFFRHSANCFDLVVADVMGKGVPAALLAAAIKSQFLSVLKQLLSLSGSNALPEPQEIVASVHSDMIEHMEDLETFVTLSYARFDSLNHEMTFVDCGHVRTIHFHEQSQTVSMLQGINMPIGFPEKEPFKQIAVPFRPGDLFFFYSDGVTESRNPQGGMYDENRLVDFIQKNAGTDVHKLIDDLKDDVIAFSKSDTFDDDFTCVAVKIVQTSADSNFSQKAELDIDSDLKELAQVRSFVQDFCKNIPDSLLDDERIDQVVLAVNEAAANIVKHAYQGRAEEKIQITADVAACQFVVRLYDWGGVFDPESVPEPEFNGSQEGGFGIYIIAQSVDEVNYSRDDEGRNCTELIINLAGGK